MFVTVQTKEGSIGIGEAAPGLGAETAMACEQQLRQFLDTQDRLSNPFDAWQSARDADVAPCAWAAVLPILPYGIFLQSKAIGHYISCLGCHAVLFLLQSPSVSLLQK